MANRSANGEMSDKRSNIKEEDDTQQSEKADEYVRELMKEKHELDPHKSTNAIRLLEQEIQKTQDSGKPTKEQKYVDIYREKPIRVSVKVLVPVREHPKFNFVGKLLGPKGNTMKRLQEETMCKMAVLGRGSMKDRQKEEEFRKSLDPKYSHLSDDLHIEISANAPPAEAHARIAFALAEVRKYLIPEINDNIRQEQLREMELVEEPIEERRPPAIRGAIRPIRGGIREGPPLRGPPPPSRPILPPPPPVRVAPPAIRPVPAKAKVFSILDRARVSMEQSYGYEPAPSAPVPRSAHHEYDYPATSSNAARYAQAERHYAAAATDDYPPPSRYASYDYEEDVGPHAAHDYYDAPEYQVSKPAIQVQRAMKYTEDPSGRAWKSYKTTTTGATSSRYRPAPYARPAK